MRALRLLAAGRLRLVVAALAALAVAGGAAAAVVLLAGGEDGGPRLTIAVSTGEEPQPEGLAACRGLAGDEARACYAPALAALVSEAPDAGPVLDEIAVEAYGDPGGFLLPNCHGIMHTVGREYAADRGVTPATLMDYLPRSNDPACAAGFAHGLVTGVAPQLDLRRPAEAVELCAGSETRYQRYSCVHGFGHAFMRVSREALPEALALCSALGAVAPDCAQGAYHDYWFAVVGADDTERPPEVVEDPHALCGAQPREFVRPCWYRALIELRPDDGVASPDDILRLCEGLAGLQREACVTAASVIGPSRPSNQMTICNDLPDADGLACIRGVKVANLLAATEDDLVALVRQCDGFPKELGSGCYRWLGKVLAVITNGEFETFGCERVPDEAFRRECVAGARSMDGPLVTFS